MKLHIAQYRSYISSLVRACESPVLLKGEGKNKWAFFIEVPAVTESEIAKALLNYFPSKPK